MILAAFLTTITAQVAPVPPPAVQVTADCSRPSYATDMLACDDPTLKAMDDRLKSVLSAMPATGGDTPLIEDQAAWFQRSRRCAFQSDHRGCALAAYSERMTVIALATAPASPAGRCLLSDETSVTLTGGAEGAALLQNGRIILVGVPRMPLWQPFVTYRRNGDKANFSDLNGRSIATCRFAQKGGNQ